MDPVMLRRSSGVSLTKQIEQAIARQIEDGLLAPGVKLPSIRVFAQDHDVSRFTVADAYDRLAAHGYVVSRPGSGFFVAGRRDRPAAPATDGPAHREEVVWLIRRLLEAEQDTILAGGPWLPESWMEEASLRRVLRTLSNNEGAHLVGYGEPLGYRPLRALLAGTILPEIGVNPPEDQILLTCGASQALDLVIRSQLAPGDTVLVDDPGYYNLFGNLRLHGLRLLGVPRGPDGPDLDALEALAAAHAPKLYFTQSVLQNPTGQTLSQHAVFRVLQTAVRHGFRVVEDDIFSDMLPGSALRLAALDQLDRVIYVRSFSKTLSGSLRVGLVAAAPQVITQMTDTKMVTSITTSAFSEKLIYRLLTDGFYRKFVTRLQDRLADARHRVMAGFDRIGIVTEERGDAGMFLWGRFEGIDDSLPLAKRGLEQGVMLAPGAVFRPNLQQSPWLRFNVAVCDMPGVIDRLAALAGAYRADAA
ncbi:MAG: aminotransferase class I/II-fold pyridoxal phosphate-dependent enzyme [Limimaricola sp.]|uniref:aminotransferase-like domain-containing protein n=1 Tax=Limimaricola sp. TaxID=2211665 RepID=UPI001D22C5DE|nr:PLP-dependent aminotransferase family protein [Limimaricola sp.]MBI1418132.1 aminotransferase class I/II-fold pyridoxal phosphate-dependent enzyme [Limimaricola sp.]